MSQSFLVDRRSAQVQPAQLGHVSNVRQPGVADRCTCEVQLLETDERSQRFQTIVANVGLSKYQLPKFLQTFQVF